MQTLKLNLIAAWLGILLGFGSGLGLGLFFNRENWLGGYNSLKRRLYRLAHISLFGLGAVNLFFYFTALRLPTITPVVVIASWGFIIGAISMPICCLLMAHFPRTHLLFSIPVASLLVAGALTLVPLIQVAHRADFAMRQQRPEPQSVGASERQSVQHEAFGGRTLSTLPARAAQ